MKKLMDLQLWYFILTIAGGFVVYKLAKQESNQQKRLQDLGEEIVKLSTESAKLEKLNHEIAQKIETISSKNLELSNQNQQLITEVKQLTSESSQLIDAVNKRTAQEAAENLKTKEIKFRLKRLKTEQVNITVGTDAYIQDKSRLAEKSYTPIRVGNYHPIYIGFSDQRPIIDVTVYDDQGNLIAEIEQNFWRQNANFTGKFNYDDHGFEVIDNKGRVSLNVDFKDNGDIKVQGIFYSITDDTMIFAGDKMIQFGKRTPRIEAMVRQLKNIGYDQAFEDTMKDANIKKLFKYTGTNWLHQRVNP